MPEPILFSLSLLANSPFIFANFQANPQVPSQSAQIQAVSPVPPSQVQAASPVPPSQVQAASPVPPSQVQAASPVPPSQVQASSAIAAGQFSANAGGSSVQPERMLDSIPTSQLRPDFLAFSSVSASQLSAPRSGGQLYTQRLAALKAGQLHTRLPKDCFREIWSQSSVQPNYEQWRQLLTLEARAVAGQEDSQPLSILVGDSLSLWFPSDRLPRDQMWLNQSISGDTTWNVLRRLSLFVDTRPNQIYVMVGINDLKMGASDAEILWNIQRIVQQLRTNHPNAKIIVQSILPTRLSQSINARVIEVNRKLAPIAYREGASYLDLSERFMDEDEQLMTNYTTDGIHLSQAGYAAWQSAVRQPEIRVAQF